MAGRAKHMARSHYSYQKNHSAAFAGFERHAAMTASRSSAKSGIMGMFVKAKQMLQKNQGR